MEKDIQDVLNDTDILLLTVEQVSKILQLGRSKTYEVVNNEDCPFVVHRFGNSLRIEKASFLKSLEKPITI